MHGAKDAQTELSSIQLPNFQKLITSGIPPPRPGHHGQSFYPFLQELNPDRPSRVRHVPLSIQAFPRQTGSTYQPPGSQVIYSCYGYQPSNAPTDLTINSNQASRQLDAKSRGPPGFGASHTTYTSPRAIANKLLHYAGIPSPGSQAL